jgi:hypothetical protein
VCLPPPPLRLLSDPQRRTAASVSRLLTASPPPFQVDLLAFALRSCPNRAMVTFVLSGLRIGFQKQFSGSPFTVVSDNHPSALQQPQVLLTECSAELAAGRRSGPYTESQLHDFAYYRVNPLGVIPKPHKPGKWRVIHDHSFPAGTSNNDRILRSDFGEPFIMDRIDVAISFIRSAGPGCLIWTEDVTAAYRTLPVAMQDIPLQGLRFSGYEGTYFEHVMVFGSRESGFIFCYLASLIVWYLQSLGFTRTSHYIDNFMGVVANTPIGRASHKLILDILCHLGIPLNASDSHLGQRVPHLGFMLDSVLMTVSIPTARRQKLISILNAATDRTSIPRSLLESVVGKLLWACQVMPAARIYLPRLLSLARKARSESLRYVHLAPVHRHDLNWFARTILQWDGFHMFAEEPWQQNEFSVIIGDACPIGGGCFTESGFCAVTWCEQCTKDDKTDSQSLEIANSLIGISTFGRHVSCASRLACLTDNAANVSSFARGRTAETNNGHRAFVTDCIRDIVQYSIVSHSEIRLLHVPRDRIPDADDLSRGLIDKFCSANPELAYVVPVIPYRFRELNNGRVCLNRCGRSADARQ